MDSANKDRLQGGMDQLKGNLKSGVGEATGDDRTRAEGEMDKAKGDLQQGLADAKDAVGDAIGGLTGQNRNG